MKEIRRGDFFSALGISQAVPALGTSYDSYMTCFPALLTFFPALCSIYLFSRPIIFFLHLAVVAHLPALLRFFPIFFPRLMLFVFKRVSFLLVLVAAVLSISEMMFFWGGRSLRKLCYGEVYESQNSTVNPNFLTLIWFYLPYSADAVRFPDYMESENA